MKNALKTVPESPEEAYEKIFANILKLGEDKTLALSVLSWVYHAKEPLKMSELQEALCFMPNQMSSVEITEAQYSRQEIIASCKSLVVAESNIVKFVHLTVKDWLREVEHQLPSVTELAKCCIRYLGKPEFANPCLETDLHAWLMKFKFGDYAARFWASHAVETETKRNIELETAILDTFSRDGRREAMERLRGRYYPGQKSLLHVLIENQLAFIFMNPVSEAECRMYFLILFKLIVRVTELVLPNGAINALDGSGATPLHYAARNGYLEAVKWLVKEAGAKVDSKDNLGRTPLIRAVYYGRLETVKFLAKEVGADVESKDNDGKTALDVARQSISEDWQFEDREGRRAVAAWLEKEESRTTDHGSRANMNDGR